MTLKKKTIDNVNLKGKNLVIRVDFNVPLKVGESSELMVANDFRIKSAIPTINYCINHEANRIVLLSHLGRPDGNIILKYSMKPVFEQLKTLLDVKCKFIHEPHFEKGAELVKNLSGVKVVLMENLRFNIGEEGSRVENIDNKKTKIKATFDEKEKYERAIKSLGDVYVNDAFGTVHRAHGSMKGTYFNIKCAGFLLSKELEYFGKVLENPQKPLVAILGGAKVKDKIQLIENMISLVDNLIICGGMVFTFLKTLHGMKIGSSLYDEEGSKVITRIMDAAKKQSVNVYFPVDFVIGNEIKDSAKISTVTDKEGVPDGFMGLDIGPKSVENFSKIILLSKTIVWNGPAGVFEVDSFAKGTKDILDIVVQATKAGSVSVIGGGDTATCCEKWNKSHLISHVSTGGGSSLELMQGLKLPGVENLDDA
ncbi:hypothetical protein A3Q56_02254 [Intoshia linei]|uniref:Phosphoglycerate kinase n=1 Tax=Intoshia linei TaxID=1819745 RepID=A0A177B8L4_9BILA|nr:hypothetical protein A3Q56_02254 [Intoshia linei]